MQCFFCPNPAAHPATGCQYSERALSCRECTVRFNEWFQQSQYRGVNAAKATHTPTFYESINSLPRKVKAQIEYRLTFYAPPAFYSLLLKAEDEEETWKFGRELMIKHKHAKTDELAKKMQLVALPEPNKINRPAYMDRGNPNYKRE